MTDNHLKDGTDFWFHGKRDMKIFGDHEDLVADFIMAHGCEKMPDTDYSNCLGTFLEKSKFNETVLSIYEFLIEEDLVLLAYCFADYILTDYKRDSEKTKYFRDLFPQDRIRIKTTINRFRRWMKWMEEKDDDRVRILLSGLNRGIVSTTILLEKFRSFQPLPENPETERRFGSNYDWYRSALNSLWEEKFLKREVSLLSELNLARGTSMYFTHTVPQRHLVDFIKMIIDRSTASRASYMRDEKKKKTRRKKRKQESESVEEKEYTEEENAEIRKIMADERISRGKAQSIFEIQKLAKKRGK